MGKSTRMTPEQLELMGLVEVSPGVYKKKSSKLDFTTVAISKNTDEFMGKYAFPDDEELTRAGRMMKESWLKEPTGLPVRTNPMTPDESFIPSVPFVRTWSPKTTDRDDTDYYTGVDPAKIGQEKTVVVKHHQGNVEVIYSSPGSITLTVLGEPTPQQRHRHHQVKGSDFVTTYDPSSKAKKEFIKQCLPYRPDKPYKQPLRVDMVFYFSRPKSHYRSGKNANLLKEGAPEYHITRPDSDNLAKLVKDALNKVFWADDSLVCDLNIKKRYDNEFPRTEITIIPL